MFFTKFVVVPLIILLSMVCTNNSSATNGAFTPPLVTPNAKPVFRERIAFTSNRSGNFEVCVMNTDGSRQTRLTNNNTSDLVPAWSPDGAKITFSSDRDGNLEIYIMNADGSGQTRLTNNTIEDLAPAWSPDGTKIEVQVQTFQRRRRYNQQLRELAESTQNLH